VDQAIAASDVFLAELPLDDKTTSGVTQRMFLPDEGVLSDVLSEELYDRLAAYLAGRGLSIAPFQRLKPWVMAVTLPLLDSLADFAKRKPLDLQLYADAEKAGKEVGGIETPEEQLGIFETLTKEEQEQLLVASLDAVEAAKEGEDPMKKMADVYLQGDEEALMGYVKEMMAGEGELSTRLAKRLIDDRNAKMAERVAARVAAAPSKTLFVAVGTAHVVGPTGLVETLRKQGWTVRRLELADRIEAPAAVAGSR
jgi:uncharacterized protein YbaP (TraB family)